MFLIALCFLHQVVLTSTILYDKLYLKAQLTESPLSAPSSSSQFENICISELVTVVNL